MKANVFIGTLSLTVLTVGVAQWSAAVTNAQDTHTARSSERVSAAEQFAEPSDTSLHSGEEGAADPAQQTAGGLSSGADIRYTSIYQSTDYSPVGNTYAYALGSRTCNLGDAPLLWQNNGTPGFASNAYRLHDGRLMQIGTSWVKHACCVANVNSPSICGVGCSQTGGGGTLNAGCLDTYSAGWNGLQGRLGPRVNINPYTGEFAPLQSGDTSSIGKRLQIDRDEMDLSNYPDALYFVEGVYVCTSTSQAGNMNNNATYRRVTFNQSTFSMSLASEQHPTVPAIFAWEMHGLGVNTPDPNVKISTLDLPNEGRFFAGAKVSDNGDGTWRYEYAVYNLNSHQAAGEFSVEVGNGVTISNVGFHSPPYHSGENQDTTPWEHEITADSITWSTTETHAENPNANAIRWGSMHNFWFDADGPPVTQGAEIGVFIPGEDDGIAFSAASPGDVSTPCPADLTGDDEVGTEDLFVLLGDWTGEATCDDCGDCPSDLNGDCYVDTVDLFILLGEWGPCP